MTSQQLLINLTFVISKCEKSIALKFEHFFFNIPYTALNLPSLIFTLCKSETDSPSLECAR